jgi:hypothetical protein
MTRPQTVARARPPLRLATLLRGLSLAGAMATALAVAGPAHAQSITLKTVPIPTGEQFLLFPTHTLGMGSTTIAVDDRLALPFTNPARRLEGGHGMHLFATPTFYGEANQWVGGRSLPMAALFAGDRFHGGVGLAVQQVQDRRGWWGGWGPVDDRGRSIQEDPSNTYLFGTVGARLTDRFSAGVSVFHATLGAVDGVNMLYGRAWSIEQDGTLAEVRLGLAGALGGDRTLEATVTTTRVDMVHDVDYMEWIWGDEPWTDPPTVIEWRERNEDHTNSWGTRLRYTQPVGETSRLGLIVAGTTKNHPKIPNYNIVDIPRDPGNSAVFNLGVGAARTEAGATVSLEVVFEPGRSHTWALADTVTALPSGATLQPGDKTVDNQFRFMNWNMGLGFERDRERLGWQLGLRVRQINYSLDQHNYLAERRRETRERWMEWTPSWGGFARFGQIELRYAGRFTAKGWPDTIWFGGRNVMALADTGVDFVVGPTGPVNIPAYRVTTHRVTVSVPFGL